MKTLKELQESYRVLLAATKELREKPSDTLKEEEISTLRSNISSLEALKEDIDTAKRMDDLLAYNLPKPKKAQSRDGEVEGGAEKGVSLGENREGERPFENLGEQLRAIYLAATNRSLPVDPRLYRLNELDKKESRAASGMNTTVDSEGGFAIQKDFAGMIFESAVKEDQILSRCDGYDVSSGANGVHYVDIDETDISSTVFGGVQVYWDGEAETVAASKPKIRDREMTLRKLTGIAYATEEMMEDTTFISQLYSKAFTKAISRKMAGDVIDGSGVGRMLGILNNNSLISVAKETGQAAATLVYKNIVKCWHRVLPDARSRVVWLVHPDVEEQFEYMEFPGSASTPPIFVTAGSMIGQNGLSTLKGRPVIPTDHCKALGTKGDIILADLDEYMLLKKMGVKQQTSLHVRFLYGETAFRFTYRANGAPKKDTALTIKNSSQTRGSFISLNTRA